MITERMLSIAIRVHNGLPGGTLPFCLNVKVKCLFQLTGKHSDPAHLWMAAEKKKTPPIPDPGQAMRYLASLTSSPPLLCPIKETGIQILISWYFRALTHPILGCLAFWIKLLFLASTSHLPVIGLLCGKDTKLGFSNINQRIWVLKEIPGKSL